MEGRDCWIGKWFSCCFANAIHLISICFLISTVHEECSLEVETAVVARERE